jgi:FAD/FMN-containing dehydrogenase
MLNDAAVDTLRRAMEGTVFLPDQTHYETFSKAWNLSVQQRPALVVVPATARDVVAAVQYANTQGLDVGVMVTGHGAGRPCDGGLLINSSRMRGVTIDRHLRRAKVEAGALWKDVIGVAHEHGLATLAGSSTHVGIVGYTMGGGFGYLGRKYGLNSASVTAAEIVTADGRLMRASSTENEDLFWATKGGGGNFGIVVSLEFRLYPLTDVYGGAVYFPGENARDILTRFSEWTKDIPDEVTAALAFMNVPDVPAAPPFLRGRSVVAIKGCYCGDAPGEGELLFEPIRKLFNPIADTFRAMPVTAMDEISKDPVDPMGVLQYAGMIRDLTPDAIDAVLRGATDAASPLLVVELRKLGGALDKTDADMKLMGIAKAQFSLNALGAASTPVMAAQTEASLSRLANITAPHSTGEVFLNSLEIDPTEERVRAAYSQHDWEKLVRLKTQLDPKNLFRFNRNIPPKR